MRSTVASESVKQEKLTPAGRLSLTRAADQKEGRGAEREDKGEREDRAGKRAGRGPGHKTGRGSAEVGACRGRMWDVGSEAGAAEEGRRFLVRPSRFAPHGVSVSAEPWKPFLQPSRKDSEETNRDF